MHLLRQLGVSYQPVSSSLQRRHTRITCRCSFSGQVQMSVPVGVICALRLRFQLESVAVLTSMIQ